MKETSTYQFPTCPCICSPGAPLHAPPFPCVARQRVQHRGSARRPACWTKQPQGATQHCHPCCTACSNPVATCWPSSAPTAHCLLHLMTRKRNPGACHPAVPASHSPTAAHRSVHTACTASSCLARRLRHRGGKCGARRAALLYQFCSKARVSFPGTREPR